MTFTGYAAKYQQGGAIPTSVYADLDSDLAQCISTNPLTVLLKWLTTATVAPNAGGGQTNATPMTSQYNRIATVLTDGDSVRLPASAVGLQVWVSNQGAKSLSVFGASTDTINGIATATGIRQGAGVIAVYSCSVVGNWEVELGGLRQEAVTVVSGDATTDAHVSGTYILTKGSAAAITLGAPTAGRDDGVCITYLSGSAQQHQITATGLLVTGSASVNTATCATSAGSALTLIAYNGKWQVLSQNQITFG